MATTDPTSVRIIPFYSHPHVHTVIRDHSQYDETVYTASSTKEMPFATVIVSGFDKGIDNKFVNLTDLETKKAIFGESNFAKYGQPSIQVDELFNGYTKVWLMRVLPDNARYANLVWLAHYRRGKILDDLGQETGKIRIEIKFSIAYATDPYVEGGAKTDAQIRAFAKSLETVTADPLTGYMTVALGYTRATGHGNYGNNYAMSITRDVDAEKDYGIKMYSFNFINNEKVTKVENMFVGSTHVSRATKGSTFINDVMDIYSEGSVPVSIKMFEEGFDTLYTYYRNIIKENQTYIQASGGNKEDVEELMKAQSITLDQFDPIFGLVYNTQNDEVIPYYRNYTGKAGEKYEAPELEIPNTAGATKPLNISDWTTATVGARVLVVADPLNEGHRWIYTVTNIDESGNIMYDDGVETDIDADQYNGLDISQSIGFSLEGGSDGDFEEITVGNETRKPTEAEMKLLLAREYVKAFRGLKDRNILSPARINLDVIFDANYNLTLEETISISNQISYLYDSSTVLTDQDSTALAVLTTTENEFTYSDLNVKQALYDLNEFRNRNGMKMNLEQGAGCSLYLDCGLVGLKNIGVNRELSAIIDSVSKFKGRQSSVDLGYYEIFDPGSNRRINVTIGYFFAKNMIRHIVTYGINKPFTNNYASLVAMQIDDDSTIIPTGEMIRNTFQPDLDLIDWDVKEKLYKERINYYLVSEEGRLVQRQSQNTRQTEASALLEENNVRVLNSLKKGLEKACRGYAYEWNNSTVRKGYTEAQMNIYRPWIGTMVEDLDIKFKADEFEQERMMMHCYVEVKFRDIIKRIILEINIRRPEGKADTK